MAYLTLYINKIPVAESIFYMPKRDPELSHEVNRYNNKKLLDIEIQKLKEANSVAITQAGSEFYIEFSVGSKLNLLGDNAAPQ